VTAHRRSQPWSAAPLTGALVLAMACTPASSANPAPTPEGPAAQPTAAAPTSAPPPTPARPLAVTRARPLAGSAATAPTQPALAGRVAAAPASATVPQAPTQAAPTSSSQDLQLIQHVIIIMQENRSFDHYFGTYPGADGIPMENGEATVCSTDPKTGECVRPYHDPNDINAGGPHAAAAAVADIHGGKMDKLARTQIPRAA
jgi:phosphoesterase family protein